MRTPPAPDAVWRPAAWLRALASAPKAAWPHSRALRAAIAVGTPLVVGALTGHAALSMWVSMGAMLLTASERDTAYSARFRQIAVAVPTAAAAFSLGLLHGAPPGAITAVMTLLAFVSGIISGYSHIASMASMQALLIGAVAIGVPGSIPYLPAALLFIGGGALYTGLLAIEAAWDRRRPQREALESLLRALAGLAHQAATGGDLVAPRRKAVTALDRYDTLTLQRRRSAQGPTAAFAQATRISRAADQLMARLLAHDQRPIRSDAAARRLHMLADAVHDRKPSPPGDDPSLVRVHLLEQAIFGRGADVVGDARPRPRPLRPPGRDLIITAVRLALCTAVAYAVMELTGMPHGYWVALTVAIVMKPDLGSVFARAVLRSAGTVGGAVIALLLGLILPGELSHGLAVMLLAAVLPWAAARNYALQTLVMTPLIMIMINLVVPTMSLAELTGLRVLATVIGGLIVILVGYALWPQARHPNLAPTFSSALAALAEFARDVGEHSDEKTTSAARRASYRALSDAGVAIQRTLAEPPPADVEAAAWLPVLSAAERVADEITDVSGSLRTPESSPDAALLTRLSDELIGFTRAPSSASAPSSDDGGSTSQLVERSAAPEDPAMDELIDELGHLHSLLTHGADADSAAPTSRRTT